MKHYKVIALSVGGPGNQIFHSGMVLTENHFRKGEAADLVKRKYLVEVEVEEETKIEEPPPAFKAEDMLPEVTQTIEEDPAEVTEEEDEGAEKVKKMLGKKEK
jgi:hypothetical protein